MPFRLYLREVGRLRNGRTQYLFDLHKLLPFPLRKKASRTLITNDHVSSVELNAGSSGLLNIR